jgi:drug/metabolite transporter (DMT)-like permease
VTAAATLGGVALAAVAAACYDGAVALQAREARALEGAPGRVGGELISGLLRRRGWLLATGLALAGWPFQVAALALAPVAVVQPTLALGLVLLLYLGARWLHEPAGPRHIAAVGAIVAGVGVLAWAAPESSHAHAAAGPLVASIGVLGAFALVPWLRRAASPGWLLVLGAGLGYAASALTSKLLADALAGPDWPAAVGWGALTAAIAGLGLGDEMAALQRVSAAGVATGAFVLQTIVPVLLAPALFDEAWSGTPLGGAAIVAGLAAVAIGSAILARAPGVTRLVASSR